MDSHEYRHTPPAPVDTWAQIQPAWRARRKSFWLPMTAMASAVENPNLKAAPLAFELRWEFFMTFFCFPANATGTGMPLRDSQAPPTSRALAHSRNLPPCYGLRSGTMAESPCRIFQAHTAGFSIPAARDSRLSPFSPVGPRHHCKSRETLYRLPTDRPAIRLPHSAPSSPSITILIARRKTIILRIGVFLLARLRRLHGQRSSPAVQILIPFSCLRCVENLHRLPIYPASRIKLILIRSTQTR